MVAAGKMVFEMTVVVVVEMVFKILMVVVAVMVVVKVEVVEATVAVVVVKDYCYYHCPMDFFYLLDFLACF